MPSRAAPIFVVALIALIGEVACGARAGLPGGAVASTVARALCVNEPGLPDSGWVKTWGGIGFDRARAIFAIPSGILVAGSFNSVTTSTRAPGSISTPPRSAIFT